MAVVLPVDVRFTMSKNALGAALVGGEFEFGLFNASGVRIYIAENDETGLIVFPSVRFTQPGLFHYTFREIRAPQGWITDQRIWPVDINVTHDAAEPFLRASVTYPEGVPVFINTHESRTCGLVEFPELTFTEPGIFEYTLEELTPSGEGWTTDDKVVKVVVIVEPDGHGNLVATIEYPEGFPSFVDIFKAHPAHIIISACKIAIGAPLPAGRFKFGLFDEEGNLVATATNEAAAETFFHGHED